MARKKRPKEMNAADFDRILHLDWAPEVMGPNERPAWLRGLPEDKVYAILASGSIADPPPQCDGNSTVHGQIGGIDVYRHAEPEDGVRLNKDWYRVVLDPADPTHLYVLGPVKDDEHHLDELPERLRHLTAKIETPTPDD